MDKIQGVTGVVLAGGRSTRMGRDKASLPFAEGSLIDSPIRILRALFPRVVLSVNPENSYPEIPLIKVMDTYPEIGPLGGITSVLEAGETRVFCVACDMPRLNPDLIRYLCSFPDADAVLPRWHGRAETLHALYSTSVLPSFRQAILEKRYRIADALPLSGVVYVSTEQIRRFDPQGLSFGNVNTPDEYEGLLR